MFKLRKVSFYLIKFSIFAVFLEKSKFHSNSFVCLCYGAAGLPLFFPGILPDLQPVYQVSDHGNNIVINTDTHHTITLCIFLPVWLTQWVTQLVLFRCRSSERWRSWILRRCPTRSCSSPRGALTVSSWWVRHWMWWSWHWKWLLKFWKFSSYLQNIWIESSCKILISVLIFFF